MAALSDCALHEVVELSRLSLNEFEPLLADEVQVWDRRYAWDFRPSADILRRFLQSQSLSGYALRSGIGIAGYGYFVCEDRKGLIGDFYVKPDFDNSPLEMSLLDAVVQRLMLTPGIRRIESQLMLARMPGTQPLPFSRYLVRHDRYFMEITTEGVARLPKLAIGLRAAIAHWADRYQEDMAHLISASYRGHVDSEINDQYRTIPGARRFLTNIIRYPGCGRFSPAASLVAVDQATGRVCGACLASLVSSSSGHITQLCVLPGVRGANLGYELLRQSLAQLAQMGCASVSLTVTCSNVDAIRLYESMGFAINSTFPALVWEGF